jgi:FADH2 O2-dependent halogenase
LTPNVDIAVVGSGFGGSLTAMVARRLGRSVLLLERGRHPRFAIGESSTPLANLLIEELAHRYDLPRIRPLSKWGTWQRTYPHIACGLKRGFSFYHHTFDRPFAADPERADQLLVAASPHDGIADTHWYRSEFDHFLVREAQALGVEYADEAAVHRVDVGGSEVVLDGERRGLPFAVRARLVLDATGPRGLLHRALNLPEVAPEGMPPTQALYSHFSGVRCFADLLPPDPAGEAPPYPPDDAALHHVFPGGWVWVLRFNNGLTSAGVAATDALAGELNFAEGAPAWDRLLARLPGVRAHFEGAEATLPFQHIPRMPFRSGRVAGPRWALLPSAAGFVDPLLSTGFPLTLLGIARLASAIEDAWDSPRLAERLRDYEAQTVRELAATERLVGALYASMEDFPLFRSLSLLYFAAASYSETVRRLGLPQRASSFLLDADPAFGPRARACAERARTALGPAERAALMAEIDAVIAPFDVAGLGRRDRRTWYPVCAEDLFAAAPRLGVDAAAVRGLLERCGFNDTCGSERQRSETAGG